MSLNENLSKSINCCLVNGKDLIYDAESLYNSNSEKTAYALIILAQEEFSKAYICKLIIKGAIPWCEEIRRAMKNHICKQLIAIFMEYIYTPWERVNEREKKAKRLGIENIILPKKIADALNIFCHEIVLAYRYRKPCWAEDINYHPEAKKIWKGYIEKKKQSSLYVSIDNHGRASNYSVNKDDVKNQFKIAEILYEVASGMDFGAFTEREMVISVFREVFENIKNDL